MSKNRDFIEKLTIQMNERIKSYQNNPEDELEMLNYMRKFYNYSMRNTMLIESQYQGAYGVASYKQHQENGYQVQKGQKSIRILAPKIEDVFIDENNAKRPLKYATKEQKQKIKNKQLKVIKSDLRGYIPVPVFDITQTDCPVEDYPKLYPNRPENFKFNGTDKEFANFFQAIKNYAKDKNIPVHYEVMSDGAQKGYYVPATNEIAIRSTLTEQEQAKVLLHELAHAEMHNHNKMKNKDIGLHATSIKEYQAEMSAYIISSSFNLDTEDYSTKYLNSWTSKENIDTDIYIESINEVKTTTKNMIEQVVARYNELELDKKQTYSLTDPNSFKHYIDTLYKQYEQSEIVVFLNEQTEIINSSVIPDNLKVGEKLNFIIGTAKEYGTQNIAYLNKDTKITDNEKFEVPSIVTEIEKQSIESNINLVDYFNVTKNGINSYQLKVLNEKNKPEKSSLKKLMDRPNEKKSKNKIKNQEIVR